MAAPKQGTVTRAGTIMLRSHGDCFLHATAKWLHYWDFNLPGNLPVVVRVTAEGRSFLTTLSPKPIPYEDVMRGMRREYYLEIDPNFASGMKLGPTIEVVVEGVSTNIEKCSHLYLVPVTPSHMDKIILNQEKIEYELLDKVRVVSAGQVIPLWVLKEVIPVQVVRSDPPSKWVLLEPKLTALHFEPSSTSPPSSALSTSTQGSETSVDSQPRDTDVTNPKWDFTHRAIQSLFGGGASSSQSSSASNSKGGSPPDDEGGAECDGPMSLSSSLMTIFRGVMWRNVSVEAPAREEPARLKEVPKLPHRTGSAGEADTEQATDGSKQSRQGGKVEPPKHVRGSSWHPESDFDSRPVQRAQKCVGIPLIKTKLRVQQHSIGHSLRIHPLSPIRHGKEKRATWSYYRFLDVFVHPSTLPEVYEQMPVSEQDSYLVHLQSLRPPYAEETDTKESGVQAKEVVVNNEEDSLLSAQEGEDGEGKMPPMCQSLVARLCFATRLVFRGDEMTVWVGDHEVNCKRQSVIEEGGQEVQQQMSVQQESVVMVKEGHIVMSHFLRRQMSCRVGSVIRVGHVSEDWSLTKPPPLTLHPLTSQPSEDLSLPLQYWIRGVCMYSPYGAPIVDGMILALSGKKNPSPPTSPPDQLVYAQVSFKHPRISSAAKIVFSLVNTKDIGKSLEIFSNVTIPSQISEAPKQEKPEKTSLPTLAKLDPPVIDEAKDKYGAIDHLLHDGIDYVTASLLDQDGGKGTLLICGQSGSEGPGSGKTSLGRLICRAAADYPYLAHISIIDCVSFRVQSVARVKRRLYLVFEEAKWHAPAVIFLDDLDYAMTQYTDPQEAIIGEGYFSTQRTHFLLDLILDLQVKQANVVVIATARSRQHLHPDLLQSRGKHIFDRVLEIAPPTLMDRRSILLAILQSQDKRVCNLSDMDIREIALKTEGYQARDLVSLTHRAIAHSCIQGLCFLPPHTNVLTPTPTRKQHPQIKSVLSQSKVSSSRSRRTPEISTVVPTSPVVESAGNHLLCLGDFLEAMRGFVPTSLQGLPLHAAGETDFSGVGGMEKVKEVLTETILWPSKYPRLFSQCPIRQRSGVLLYGAPGTGKTYLAGAVACEFRLNFISIKGPELLSKYIGASEQAVRDMFARAQAAKPCILFFDEFDSLAPKRGHDSTGVTDRVVNQLLTQLDGVETLHGVYILAASSRPDLIDPALLRPGRIDRSIFCNMPTQEEREAILGALACDLPLGDDVDFNELAKLCKDYTGADLKAVLYNAQLEVAHETLEITYDESLGAGQDGRDKGEWPDTRGLEDSNTTLTDLPLTARRGVATGGGAMVFNWSATGVEREGDARVEEKEYDMYRGRGRGMVDSEVQRSRQHLMIKITQEHLLRSYWSTRPSVTEDERRKFNEIYNKFQGKTSPSSAIIQQLQRVTMA